MQLPGQRVALAVADHQVRLQLLGHLADLEEIHALEHLRLLGQGIGGDGGDGLFKLARGAARSAEHGPDADLGEKGAQADDQILFAVDHGPFAEHILVAVHIGVHQAAALFGVFFRGRPAAQFFQQMEEGVGLADAHRHAEAMMGDAEFLRQDRAAGGDQGRPEFNRRPGAAHGPDRGQWGAAALDFLVGHQGRTVHGLGQVGQHAAVQAEVGHDLAEQAVIGRADEPGQQVDGPGQRPAFAQLGHHRTDGGVEPLHVGAGITGRGHVDQGG